MLYPTLLGGTGLKSQHWGSRNIRIRSSRFGGSLDFMGSFLRESKEVNLKKGKERVTSFTQPSMAFKSNSIVPGFLRPHLKRTPFGYCSGGIMGNSWMRHQPKDLILPALLLILGCTGLFQAIPPSLQPKLVYFLFTPFLYSYTRVCSWISILTQ